MKERSEWHYHIMQVVRNKGNINDLLYGDYVVEDIVEVLHSFVAEGIMKRDDGIYSLTEAGNAVYINYIRSKRGINRYVFENKLIEIEAISTEEIYIPRKRKK